MERLHHLSSFPRLGALPESTRQRTLGSASHYLRRCRCHASSSVGARFMTELTWTRGWMTISTEGGPERRLYGP